MFFLSTGAVPKACPLSIDGGSDGVDALDGNLGDDDGDTWSQGEDDPYLGVTWYMGDTEWCLWKLLPAHYFLSVTARTFYIKY